MRTAIRPTTWATGWRALSELEVARTEIDAYSYELRNADRWGYCAAEKDFLRLKSQEYIEIERALLAGGG